MQIPLQITFRGIEGTEPIEANIREKAAKLDQFAEHITSCRVVVESPHKHHHKGRIYTTTIDVTLPGGKIAASRHPDDHHAHEDAYVAIRDAFDAVYRQIEDYVRRQRHDVKSHAVPPHGIIKELYPHADYGVIETSDDREVYFHRNSVLNEGFDKLQQGTRVHFTEEMGEKGPQASSVHIEGKHHAG